MKKVDSRDNSSGQRADRRALAEINDLVDDGVYEAASVLAWEVQRASPGDPAIWLLLTRIDYLRERYAAAMYAARMATRLDPSSAQAWSWLARTAATRGRWRTEGLDAALQATALAPADPQTWVVLAQLHLARNARYEAAIAAERAVRVGPGDVAAHRTLGVIAMEAAEWSHAAAAFRRVLHLDADDGQARAGLARALEAQHIDPAGELAGYGPVSQRPTRHGGRVRRLATNTLNLSDPGPLRARRVRLLTGVVACMAVGALVGYAAPALGPARGLVGAAALALMWVAVWPLELRPSTPAVVARQAPSRHASTTRGVTAPAGNGAVAAPAVAVEVGRTAAASTGRAGQPAQLPAREPRPAPVRARGDREVPVVEDGPVVDDVPVGGAAAAPPVRPGPSRTDRSQARTAARTDARRTEPDGRTDGAAPDVAGPGRPPRPARPAPGSTRQPAHVERDDTGHRQRDDRERTSDDLPDDPGELVELSRIRLAEFDLVAARAAAVRLAEVAPDSLDAHRALAAVSLADQDYPQAEWHYGKVLEIEPLDQEAHERLAMAKKGRRREAQPQRQRRRRG